MEIYLICKSAQELVKKPLLKISNGHNGNVDALNATDGSVIWQFATNIGIESSPTVVEGLFMLALTPVTSMS